MKNPERVFAHPSQLNSLSTLPFVRTGATGKLRLGGSIANHPNANRWEQELNQNFFACGCDTSAKSLIVGFLAGCAWAVYSYFTGKWSAGFAIAFPIAVAVGAGLLGKGFGLIRANGRLKRTVHEIQKHWQSEQVAATGDLACG